jgi:hypothetical protein
MSLYKTLAVLYRYMVVALSTLVVVVRYKYRDGYSLLSCLYYKCYFVLFVDPSKMMEVSLALVKSVPMTCTIVHQTKSHDVYPTVPRHIKSHILSAEQALKLPSLVIRGYNMYSPRIFPIVQTPFWTNPNMVQNPILDHLQLPVFPQ